MLGESVVNEIIGWNKGFRWRASVGLVKVLDRIEMLGKKQVGRSITTSELINLLHYPKTYQTYMSWHTDIHNIYIDLMNW